MKAMITVEVADDWMAQRVDESWAEYTPEERREKSPPAPEEHFLARLRDVCDDELRIALFTWPIETTVHLLAASGGRIVEVPPAEIASDDPPAGYRYEWVADERCRVATIEERETRKCRRPNCEGEPVMALERRSSARSTQWWLYCSDHTYGRRIHQGVVESRRLIPDETASEGS